MSFPYPLVDDLIIFHFFLVFVGLRAVAILCQMVDLNLQRWYRFVFGYSAEF